MTTVFHKLFGEGQVIAEDNNAITIEFENGQTKKLLKGATLVLFATEEEMNEQIEKDNEAKAAAREELYKPVDTRVDGETIYEIRRRLERKNFGGGQF